MKNMRSAGIIKIVKNVEKMILTEKIGDDEVVGKLLALRDALRQAVREGKMTCTSCHNNHGSENNNLNKETLNDLCVECHAEYQGPFVYEHAPVVEDCSVCHDPHGTIANNLLLQNRGATARTRAVIDRHMKR